MAFFFNFIRSNITTGIQYVILTIIVFNLMNQSKKQILGLLLLIFFCSCIHDEEYEPLFVLMDGATTGVNFTNKVEDSEDFNIFSYRNFYNGAGVATGDVNGDGLIDIYFANNMGSNALYLNRGDWKFEEVARQSGCAGTRAWSTGVVMVDINQDGLLDIYVCNAGFVSGDDQQNELFVHQGYREGQPIFREAASEYGLDMTGYTTHAAFFDYDRDGDLDAYMLNNSFMPVNTLNYSNKRELPAEEWPVRDFLKGGGDKLLRNDHGVFTDVTSVSGIYSSLIGFGLGVSAGDVNGDHWPDLYVSNDFFERDYLYLNQGDGTFRESIKDATDHISLFSMGADMADINNDGSPDIFVTDMLPESDERLKQTTVFEHYNIYRMKQERDFYHQFMHNTLQVNDGTGKFIETARFSGVEATDWSWGALLFDVDNDGLRDIYVCNGIQRDVTDQDFIDFFANEVIQQMAFSGEKEDIEHIIERMPSTPLVNKLYLNLGGLKFRDAGLLEGITSASYSNGATYADLDNDGDLDLVVNNLNQEAFLYKNRATELLPNHYIKFSLAGQVPNLQGIGAKVSLYTEDGIRAHELYPMRGFQSSTAYPVLFGLGELSVVDSVDIIWGDGYMERFGKFIADSTYVLTRQTGKAIQSLASFDRRKFKHNYFMEADIPFQSHQEDDHVDFLQEGLTHRLVSREGPATAKADLDLDGVDELFIGNARGSSAAIYRYSGDQGWVIVQQDALIAHAGFEDVVAKFFDANGDGYPDLLVGSGGNFHRVGSPQLQDRLYINNGMGQLALSSSSLPVNGYNTSDYLIGDFDRDGDEDILAFSRSVPMQYGINPRHFVWLNDGTGQFTDVTERWAPELRRLGMVSSASWLTDSKDGELSFIVTGDWMAPAKFIVEKEKIREISTGLESLSGWWYKIAAEDLDGDGYMDLVLGNRGENFYFSADSARPVKLWVSDFDNNGSVEKIMTRHINGRDMPVSMKKELTDQIVSLKKQNLQHSQYSKKSILDLFGREVLKKAQVREARNFRSVVAWGRPDGQFDVCPLPARAQLSSISAVSVWDIDNDGLKDIILAGNDHGFLPQYSRLDGDRGTLLLQRGDRQFEYVDQAISGFNVRGVIREIIRMEVSGRPLWIFIRNNDKPIAYELTKEISE